MTSINIWPILVASIVAFGIGSLWYSPILFGKAWMALNNIGQEDMAAAKAGSMTKSYVVQMIATIVSFCVLGFIMAQIGNMTARDGLFLGVIAWLGLVLPNSLSGLLWKKQPFKLFLIETVNTLVTLAIGGAIIGAWR